MIAQMADWATAAVYFGGLLLVVCVCGALAESYLLKDDGDEED